MTWNWKQSKEGRNFQFHTISIWKKLKKHKRWSPLDINCDFFSHFVLLNEIFHHSKLIDLKWILYLNQFNEMAGTWMSSESIFCILIVEKPLIISEDWKINLTAFYWMQSGGMLLLYAFFLLSFKSKIHLKNKCSAQDTFWR